MRVLDGGRAPNGGNPPPQKSRFNDTSMSPNHATERPAANASRGGAEGSGSRTSSRGVRRRRGRSGPIPRARSIRAPTRRICPRGLHQGVLAPRTLLTQPVGGGDYGTAYAERAEIYNLVRDSKVTGCAIVSGDRHSFWAGYAAAELPPAQVRAGRRQLRRRLDPSSAPARWSRSSTACKKDHPLRALFTAPTGQDGRRRTTGPTTCCSSTASARASNTRRAFDLDSALAAVEPGARAAPRVRRHGRSRLCDGAARRPTRCAPSSSALCRRKMDRVEGANGLDREWTGNARSTASVIAIDELAGRTAGARERRRPHPR